MKIKIIKCSNTNWWYYDLIGVTLNVENTHNDIYLLDDDYKEYQRMSLGTLGISKNDCIILREEKLKRILQTEYPDNHS